MIERAGQSVGAKIVVRRLFCLTRPFECEKACEILSRDGKEGLAKLKREPPRLKSSPMIGIWRANSQ